MCQTYDIDVGVEITCFAMVYEYDLVMPFFDVDMNGPSGVRAQYYTRKINLK
jgi:hypothetical protein